MPDIYYNEYSALTCKEVPHQRYSFKSPYYRVAVGFKEIEDGSVQKPYTIKCEEITIGAEIAHRHHSGMATLYEKPNSANLKKIYGDLKKRKTGIKNRI
ncbi:MAG: hypothetical protein GX335_00565 [Firmicutes bacterium]|nr:hypothetical protein [Bacillota bacterium]